MRREEKAHLLDIILRERRDGHLLRNFAQLKQRWIFLAVTHDGDLEFLREEGNENTTETR